MPKLSGSDPIRQQQKAFLSSAPTNHLFEKFQNLEQKDVVATHTFCQTKSRFDYFDILSNSKIRVLHKVSYFSNTSFRSSKSNGVMATNTPKLVVYVFFVVTTQTVKRMY